jgi:hypothetical protein
MEPSTPLIKLNKEARDRQRRKDLRISFVPFLRQEQYPRHLRHTFHQIKLFKDYDFSTYCKLPPSTSSQPTWRNDTRARAERIAEIAKVTLLEGKVSEIEWRLRLEELVLARFRFDIKW